jgi:hypothetical protein
MNKITYHIKKAFGTLPTISGNLVIIEQANFFNINNKMELGSYGISEFGKKMDYVYFDFTEPRLNKIIDFTYNGSAYERISAAIYWRQLKDKYVIPENSERTNNEKLVLQARKLILKNKDLEINKKIFIINLLKKYNMPIW